MICDLTGSEMGQMLKVILSYKMKNSLSVELLFKRRSNFHCLK
jgi:hypothetical protein